MNTCGHNSHHQQTYINNRIYLKHNVMAELEKIQSDVCTPGLVKMASGELFSAREPRTPLQECCPKNSPAWVFLHGYFSEYQYTTGNLVNTFHSGGADMRNQSHSLHEAASVVNTLCHPNAAGTSYSLWIRRDNLRWKLGVSKHVQPRLSQAQLHCTVTFTPV